MTLQREHGIFKFQVLFVTAAEKNQLIMISIFPALEHLSTEECKSGAGLVVAAGDAFHLQLKVHLRRFASRQVSKRRAPPERSRQEVVGLSALVL